MSGVAGLLNLTQAPVDPALLQRLTDAMAHRGPDGRGTWVDGPVGLGHRLLHTTPESLQETQPLISDDEQLALVFDGRIDNRAELTRALPPGITEDKETDASLVLRAYQAWGVDCPQHLIGDFAFAVWDHRQRRLFCARDPFGVKPLFYYHDGRRFVFASDLEALFTVGVPMRPNEAMIAQELLSSLRVDYHDPEATYFDGIKQLRPAHHLSLEGGSIRSVRYWAPDPGAVISHPHLDDYLDHFRELFREAVRCRLRSQGPVGVALSGGIDSTLVTATAEALRREHPSAPGLLAFTLQLEGLYREEQEAMARLARECGTAIQPVSGSTNGSALFETFVSRCATPHHHGFVNNVALFQAMAAQGCRVVLTGFAANELCEGAEEGWLMDLFRQGRWLHLAREIRRKAWAGHDPAWPVALDCLNDQIPSSLRRMLKILQGTQTPSWITPPAAARQNQFQQRALQERRHFPTWCQEHSYRLLTRSSTVLTLNQADEAAAREIGGEWRFPFLDRRLVEWYLAVPAHIKLRPGYRKCFIQQAVSRRTPSLAVRPRMPDDTTIAIPRKIGEADRRLDVDRFLKDYVTPTRDLLGHYVNLAELQHLMQQYLNGQHGIRTIMWKLVGVAQWMREFFPMTRAAPHTPVNRTTTQEAVHERDYSHLQT